MAAEADHWHLLQSHPCLAPGQVHVWRAWLDLPAAQVADFQSLLSPDEAERAGRFVFERDRRRYVVARGVLRVLLAAYLQTDARGIVFEYGPYGKPLLSPARTGTPLFFNTAHSHEIAVYGITRSGPTGIDVEYCRSLESVSSLIPAVFTDQEMAVFRSLPVVQQRPAFYNGWTRKEAFIKAIGEGLSFPLQQFDVSVTPDRPAQLLRVQGEPDAPARWQMRGFTPAADYAGAVVVEARSAEVSFWQFTTNEMR